MPATTPLVSVIMPLCNGAAHVSEALESLGTPSADELEVIVVDDGSTDNSRQIVERFHDRLPLSLIARQHSGNWVQTTNRGMERARGEYLCWLHQDDRWEPKRMTVLKRLLAHRPQTWLIHPSRFIDVSGATLGIWCLPFAASVKAVPAAELHRRLCIQNFLASPAPVIHRRLVERVGLADESLWYTPDWDYWLRLARTSDCLVSSESLTAFRIHASSQTVTSRRRTDELQREYDLVLARHLDADDLPTSRTSRFSAALNVALLQGNLSRQTIVPLMASAFQIPPWEWPDYFRNSRIFERVQARWRLGRTLRLAQQADQAPALSDAVMAQSDTTVETVRG